MSHGREFSVQWRADPIRFTLHHEQDVCATVTLRGVVAAGEGTHDPDEVEHRFMSGSAEVLVRCSMGIRWTVRCVVSNPTQQPVSVDDLNVAIEPVPGWSAWVWAAGAAGLVTLAPDSTAGPVLAARLRRGHLSIATDGEAAGHRALRFTPSELVLEPGQRYVSQWELERLDELASAAAVLPAWLPSLDRDAGDAWVVAGVDQALVGDAGVTVTEEDSDVTVAGRPGRHRLAVHDSDGVTDLQIVWAESADVVTARVATDLVRAGEPLCAAGALVIAEALSHHWIAAPQAARTLLDAWRPAGSGLLEVAARCAHASHTGRAELLTQALRWLRGMPAHEGYGRVVMRAWLAAMALGVDAPGIAGLLGTPASHGTADLELLLLTYPDEQKHGKQVAGVVNELGAALPGESLTVGPVRAAMLAGLLELVPEQWQVAPLAARAAEKTRRTLLADVRIDDPSTVESLAWLLVGPR